jgi:hypothetical protein
MPAQSFEYKFSQLADSQLSEKAPSLIKYKVGFQILDKNDDDTKAVGVMAFVINNVWAYMPIFFMEGGLAGMDLLYLKQNDIFAPSSDSWISAVKAQGDSLMGKPVSEEEEGDGVLQVSDADLGTEKLASLDSANGIISKEELCSMLKVQSKSVSLDLMDKLACMGKDAVTAFVHTLSKSPDFANAVLRYYTPEDLQKVAAAINEVTMVEAKPAETEVEFIVDIDEPAAKALEDSEKKVLLRQGMYVKDGRKSFSKIFGQSIQTGTCQTPNYSGIYDVLMRDGTFKTMLILVLPGSASKYGSKSNKVALIDFTDPTYYYVRPSCEVFCKTIENMALTQDQAKVGGIKATKTALKNYSKPSSLLFAQGSSKVIEGYLNYESTMGGTIVMDSLNTCGHECGPCCDSGYTVDFTGKPGKLTVSGRTVFIPEDTRIFMSAPWEKNKKLTLGTLDVIYAAMVKEAELQPLHIYAQGGLAQVVSGKGATGLLDKTAALKHLVLREGIFAGQAQQLLKEASRNRNNACKYFIQYAPAFLHKEGAKTENAVSETTHAVGGKALASQEMPKDVVDKVVRASEAGIKEVFDTSVLKSLIEIADVSELRKDFITDMIKGMDRTGRMLFLYYWHNEDFAEKYGDEDMEKLENTLKQVFVSMGDLVLFLKEKMADSPNSADSLFGSLSESIGGADVEKAGY